MSKYIAFRVADKSLIDWLESHQNVSETIKLALMRAKRGEELSGELLQRLDTLLSVTERIDKRDKEIRVLLQKLLNNND